MATAELESPAAEEIVLRDYQDEQIRRTHRALREVNRVIFVAPCGSGKRIVATWWAGKIIEKQRRVLVVTNRRTLIFQMRDEMRRRGVPYGIIMSSEPTNPDAGCQIASIQTLRAREWDQLPQADWVIVDEAHGDPAAYATLFEKYRSAKIVGMTATPVGPQGRTLLGTFDQIIEGVTNSQLIASKHLIPTEMWSPSEPDVDGVLVGKKQVTVSGGQEFNQEQLGKLVESCTVFADVFRWWSPFQEMQTICFTPRLVFAHGIAEEFRKRKFEAEVIEGGTAKKKREELFEAFRKRDLRVLLSCDVLREGLDLPIAQCGIDLQPNHQFRTFWQKIGRVKRPHGDQDKAVWLDFAGNYWRFIHPDQDPDWAAVTGEKTTQDVLAEKRTPANECPRCHRKVTNAERAVGICSACGAALKQHQPWTCPQCKYTPNPGEMRDKKCPQCGFEIKQFVRTIRMEGGKLRQVIPSEKKKVQASVEQRTWDSCRYKAFYCRKTLDFARFLYYRQTGKWPPGNLKYCPSDPHSADWQLLVSVAFPHMAQRSGKV